MAAQSELISERSATFHTGDLFYKPKSRIIRDLGVLALAVLGEQRQQTEPLQVLDAMSGSGALIALRARDQPHVRRTLQRAHVWRASAPLQFATHCR